MCCAEWGFDGWKSELPSFRFPLFNGEDMIKLDDIIAAEVLTEFAMDCVFLCVCFS